MSFAQTAPAAAVIELKSSLQDNARVYAVGDVRAGSVKRVASAVGQGSVVVSHIHRAIAELEEA